MQRILTRPLPARSMPCKSAFCTKLHYATAGGSNRHMSTLHPEEDLEPYPVLVKPRKKRAPPAVPVSASELAPLDGTRASSVPFCV